MNKRETIRQTARRTGLTYHQVQIAYEAMIAVWSEALSQGESLTISHFVTLTPKAFQPAKEVLAGQAMLVGNTKTLRKTYVRVYCRTSPELSHRLKKLPISKRKRVVQWE